MRNDILLFHENIPGQLPWYLGYTEFVSGLVAQVFKLIFLPVIQLQFPLHSDTQANDCIFLTGQTLRLLDIQGKQGSSPSLWHLTNLLNVERIQVVYAYYIVWKKE